MPSTSPANIQASPSRRRVKSRPICGSQGTIVRTTWPSSTDGVSQPRMASPPNGASAASQAAVERELRGKAATAAAIRKGRASSRGRLGSMQGIHDSRAGQGG
ncbi:hypothetical protein G6F65_016368 [Rhizopus arrhizus]|nr:hypothetical protein G6F65_016368 [Rhizopus arrhizus]